MPLAIYDSVKAVVLHTLGSYVVAAFGPANLK